MRSPRAVAWNKAIRCERSSTPPAPAQPHTKPQACEHCSSQLFAVGNRNETGLLLTDLYNTYGNRPYHSTASPAFATRTGIAHTASTRPGTVAIHYFCNWYDRFAVV